MGSLLFGVAEIGQVLFHRLNPGNFNKLFHKTQSTSFVKVKLA